MTSPVERTGELVAVWRPGVARVESAPWRAAATVDAVAELDHDPAGVLDLPGNIRYFVGCRHPRQPGLVYLHRLR